MFVERTERGKPGEFAAMADHEPAEELEKAAKAIGVDTPLRLRRW